jgi:hypothetical protein
MNIFTSLKQLKACYASRGPWKFDFKQNLHINVVYKDNVTTLLDFLLISS